MCANYEAPEQLALDFDTQPVTFETRSELYPAYFGPILLPLETHDNELMPVRAMFGMVPHWAKDTKLARQTYNSRSETVTQKPSFRSAWKHHQFCLVPVQSFYEPKYDAAGKSERWRIYRRDGKPFALAGIFETAPPKDETHGDKLRSFSMLTINATDHPLMKQFHGPDDEKRSVVILERDDYHGWLHAKSDNEARSYLRPFDPAEYTAEPAPKLPRATAVKTIAAGAGGAP